MQKFFGWVIVAVAVLTLQTGCKNSGSGAEGDEAPEPVKYGIPYGSFELVEGEVGKNETMSEVFERFGLGAGAVYRIEQASKDTFDLRKVRAGHLYTAFVQADTAGVRKLHHFVYEKNLTDYLVISLFGDSVVVYNGQKPVRIERRHATAEISSSLWNAIVDNDLPAALAAEMEDIYGWSIDFFGIQAGDSFEVIYDQRYVDTMPAGVGRIWGAVFHHAGRANYAIPFKQNDKIAYWDENGNSLRKHFLKAPLKFTRISSKFSNARLHPIYRVYRPHLGVDYAAPSGTPVQAVADGVVTSRGWAGGGGNTVWIKHARGYQTGYLHLRAFAKGLSVGSRVKQGQLIGYVGSTGSSTGPHLDYRVKLNGKPLDPLKIPQEPGEPVRKQDREEFGVVRDKVMGELAGTLPEGEWLRQLDSVVIPALAPAPVNPVPADTTANLIDGKRK
ncbi:MAG: M23 family metallopeptidase [Rikenellaceae bacterium]|jgi:murein DD-endopeptidase MepM/ murein hydrolase activator NlpD|nr:M23 family metallopeptidase [Rikenellaceae bacterium]